MCNQIPAWDAIRNKRWQIQILDITQNVNKSEIPFNITEIETLFTMVKKNLKSRFCLSKEQSSNY